MYYAVPRETENEVKLQQRFVLNTSARHTNESFKLRLFILGNARRQKTVPIKKTKKLTNFRTGLAVFATGSVRGFLSM
jgi:hypothetical protein